MKPHGDERSAWSPSGKWIALPLSAAKGDLLLLVDVASGEQKRLALPGGQTSALFGQEWVNDDELVLNLQTSQGTLTQLWRYSLAAGNGLRLTNDLNGYLGVSLSKEGNALSTSRSDIRVKTWIGDRLGRRGAVLVPPALYNHIVVQRATVAWSGSHVLFSAASTRPEMETGAGYRISTFRATPPEGSAIEIVSGVQVVAGTRSGDALFFITFDGLSRSDLDGQKRTAVTSMVVQEGGLALTRSGRVVFGAAREDGVVSLWTVPVTGGEPVRLTQAPTPNSFSLDLSPDDRRILFMSGGDTIIVCDLPECSNQMKHPRYGVRPRWTPDGKGIAYVEPLTRSNIWIQPLDGETPYQLTQFTDGDQIGDYRWNHDGDRLAVTLVSMPTDIVMMKRPQRRN